MRGSCRRETDGADQRCTCEGVEGLISVLPSMEFIVLAWSACYYLRTATKYVVWCRCPAVRDDVLFDP